MAEEIFVVINEPDKSPRRIVLEGVLEIGRESDGEIVDDTEVSRHHLKLLPSPNGLKVVDLGSSNGTRVNGVLISEPTAVKPGDVIRLGRTEVMVGSPPPPPPSSPTTGALAATPAAPHPATTAAPLIPEPTTVTSAVPAAPSGRRAPRHPGAAAERPAALTVADVKPNLFSSVSAMVRKILAFAMAQPRQVVRAVVVAALFLIVASGALKQVDANALQLKSASVLLPAAVLLAVSGISRASDLAVEVNHGFVDWLLLSTSGRFPVLIGCMIADFVVGAVVAVPLVLLGLAMGLHFATGIGGLVAVVVLAAAWAGVFGGLWYGIAIGTANPNLGPLEYGTILVLLLVSPALVPRSAMASWLGHVVAVNPVTYVVNAMRILQSDKWDSGALVKAVIALFVVAVVSLAVASVTIRSRVRATMASRSSRKAPRAKSPAESEAEMLRAALEAERQARLRLEERLAAGG